jgi:predicted RNase H-like HicB family nuclease
MFSALSAPPLNRDVSRDRIIRVKRELTVIITREGEGYVARCREVGDVVAHGATKEDALKKIETVIRKKFEDGPEDSNSQIVG